MTPEQQQRRAQAYESIFRSEQFEEAFQTVRAKLLEEFERSKPAEDDKRERIHLSLTLLKLLQASIGEAIANGELSRRQIAAINGDKKGITDWFSI